MRLLSFSLDSHMLDPTSAVAARARGYGTRLARHDIIVPSGEERSVELAENVVVHASGGRSKVLQLWRLYRKAEVLLRDGEYDVVSSQDYYYLGLAAYLLAKRYQLGLEVQAHGVEQLVGVRARLARFVLARAGSVRVVSQRLAEFLASEYGVSRERMVRIPVFVDTAAFSFHTPDYGEEQAALERARRAFAESYGEYFNFLSVSRLVPVKNISLQLRALQTLQREFSEVRLHIVGTGPQREALERETTERGLEDLVVFHGEKQGPELGAYFAEADCFLLTSNSEGWGMAAIEAAAAGLPIIMTDVGCAGEVLKNGESGLVVPVGDVDAFTASMRRVVLDAPLRARLSEGARAAAAMVPTFDDVATACMRSWEQAKEHRY